MIKGLIDNHRTSVQNLLTNIKIYQLNTFPHHIHPNADLVQNRNYARAQESTRICATYPLPLISNINESVRENIALKLVQQKSQYVFDVRKASTCFEKANKSAMAKKLHQRGIYSIHLNNVIELIEQDPDPYFFGSYNWYYSGGNLEILPLDDNTDVMLHTSGASGNILNFSVMTMKDDAMELESLHHSYERDTIYEIFKAQNNQYVAIRQKNVFKVLYIDNDYSKESMKTKQFSSDIPFISGAFMGNHKFMSVDMFRRVHTFDLKYERQLGIRKMGRPTNNSYWCQLKTFRNRIFFADSKSLQILDNRTFSKKNAKGLRLNLSQVTEVCEDITGLRMSDHENHFHVATTHNLFTFDIRKCTGAAAQLTRSTHQLRTPPMVMDSACLSSGRAVSETLFAVAGSLADDIAITHMIKNHVENTMHRTPMRKIPSVINSYDKLRENGALHDTLLELMSCKDLAKRQITGLRIHDKDMNVFLLQQNCFGEIFYQNISTCSESTYEKPEFTHDNLELWKRTMCNKTPDEKSKKFTATTVTNFNSMQFLLKYDMPIESDESPVGDDLAHVPRWRKSVDELAQYKDILTADLLNVWSIKTGRFGEEKQDREELVNTWLNSSRMPANRPLDESNPILGASFVE